MTTSNITDDAVIKSYQFSFPALNNVSVAFNDRTIIQLRNSGNMRLIRNQKVNDGLVNYWSHVEIVTKTLERHTSYRTRGRDMETRIFNIAEIFVKNNGSIAKPTVSVHLINNDNCGDLFLFSALLLSYQILLFNSIINSAAPVSRTSKKSFKAQRKQVHFSG